MSKIPEIGVLSNLVPDASNLKAVADFGLPCAQVCSWDKNLCTLDLARKVKADCAAYGVRITAFWSGYTGPAVWNFKRGPVTLGLVPPTYRNMRIPSRERSASRRWFPSDISCNVIL